MCFYVLPGKSRQQNGMNGAIHGLLALLIIPSMTLLVLSVRMVSYPYILLHSKCTMFTSSCLRHNFEEALKAFNEIFGIFALTALCFENILHVSMQ